MCQPTFAAAGTFCWPELAASDVAAAKAFYGQLWRWQPADRLGSPRQYSVMRLGDRDAAGIYQMSREQLASGASAHWVLYLKVDDMDGAVAKVPSLGGSVTMEPVSVDGIGRMALVKDPCGAAFALWEDTGHKGAGVFNENGAMCWVELTTQDPVRATRFYTDLAGWTTNVIEVEGFHYTQFLAGDKSVAGMMSMKGPEWESIPPHWMVYFNVQDCMQAVEEIRTLGGSVCVPPTDIPGVGRFAMVNDPQGAVFSIIQF